MKISRRSFLAGGSAVLAGLGASALTGCSDGLGNVGGSTVIDAGVMTASSAYASTNITPLAIMDTLSHAVGWHVYEGLYQLDHTNGEIYDGIANGNPIPVDENDYEIEIKTNKQFSDGAFINTEIVRRVLGTYMNNFVFSVVLDFIRSVEIVNSSRIRLNMRYKFDVDLVKRRLCTVRIYKEGSSTNGQDESILGSGPYMLKNANGLQGQAVEFSPNGRYNGDKPARAKSMVWYVEPEDQRRIKQLVEGKSMLIEDIPFTEIDNVKTKGYEVDMQDSYSMPLLMFNTSQAPFNDLRIRQAVMYAINEDKLLKDQLKNNGEVPKSCLPSSNPNFHECGTSYAYNPALAKTMLVAAGRPSLFFNLVVQPSASAENFVNELRENLSDVGITCNVRIETVNWDTVLDENYSNLYDAILSPFDPSLFGNDTDILLSAIYGESAILKNVCYYDKAPGNRYEELQKLLDEARMETGFPQQQA